MNGFRIHKLLWSQATHSRLLCKAVTLLLDRTASHATRRGPYSYRHDNPKFYRTTNNSNPWVKNNFNAVPNFAEICRLFNFEGICASKYSGSSHIYVFPKM